MRIAAISDLHIGACERTDGFAHDEAVFLGFLDRLQAEHERVVLLGDIFQTEHGTLPGRRSAARQLAHARARVPRLCQRMRRPDYAYVHGNHDAIAHEVLGAATRLRIADSGFVAYFVHGHQFDPLLQYPMYPLSRAATWFTGRLRRARLGPLAEYFEQKDVQVKHRRLGGPSGPYARAARRLLVRERADCVVMGHTHVACRHEFAEGVLANTGTCSRGQISYVSIDTAARTVVVRQR